MGSVGFRYAVACNTKMIMSYWPAGGLYLKGGQHGEGGPVLKVPYRGHDHGVTTGRQFWLSVSA